MNNYKVDAHALDIAELIGCKSMPGPLRPLMVEEERRRTLTRGTSNVDLNACLDNSFNGTHGGEVPVGPLLRFRNPRIGQPRLTIYETI